MLCKLRLRDGFKITPAGSETTLHKFTGYPNDGADPDGVVVMNHVLYGTTLARGKYHCSSSGYCGTLFKVTLSGKEEVIHNFEGGADGAYPNQLIAVDGDLYGTTQGGGAGCLIGTGCGAVFEMTPLGQETILFQFKYQLTGHGGQDGRTPSSGLIDVGGTLYGTTVAGGAHTDGTVFAVTAP